MARKNYTPDQIVRMLRQVEVLGGERKQTWHRVKFSLEDAEIELLG
jgi:hypothetical protein